MNRADASALVEVARTLVEPAAPRVQAQQGSETRWRGASRVLRSMVSWIPHLGSPTRDLSSSERSTLVARSRDALRNHLLGRAAITRVRTNVVGTGLICFPQVDYEALGISEEAGERLNAQLEREWTLYAENPRECDAESSCNHYQLQALALVGALSGGDVFVTTPQIERAGTLYSTRLQLIETDRICNPNGLPDTETLVEGIEFDALGSPIAVHICSGYPNDKRLMPPLRWSRLEVFGRVTGRRRVLQVWCDKERPGQKRGAPYLAPVLEPLQKLERFSSAELMAAVIGAMFTVFLKKDPEFSQGNLSLGGLGSEGGGYEADEAGHIQLGEGAIVDLAPGEEPVFAQPSRPSAQFDPFFNAIAKEIGAALELPLDELLLHYSASYSAARAAMLQAWRFYAMRRWWLVCDFCQPSYELLIDEAVARGRLQLPDFQDPAKRRAYTRALWIGPARGAIDELKEANAAGKRIEIGVSNETLEAAAMSGEPWQRIYQQRQRELARRKADGSLPQAQTPPQTALDPEEQPDA